MSKLNSKQLLYPLSGSFTGSLLGSASYASSSFASISSSYVKIIPGYNIAVNYTSEGIQISSSGGGSQSPAGGNGQIQYNASSFFGGVPTLTYDGSILRATGSFTGSFSGSLFGTSSWSINSKTASYVENYVLNSNTSSFITNNQTSSFVLTSSFNSYTSSLVTNNQTSSFVTNSQTSSFVQNSQTSSFVTNNQTGSFVTNSQTSSFVQNNITSSFVINNQTSSFVLTSSFNSYTSSLVTTSSFNNWTGSSSSRFFGTASYALNVTRIDTSSFITTASVSLNTILFSKGDGTTFPITVNTGSGTGGGGTPLAVYKEGNLLTPSASSIVFVGSGISTAYGIGGEATIVIVTGSGGGGGGTTYPGGSSTQIQYNNGGNFSGVPSLTYDGSILRATGSFTGSFSGSLQGTASLANLAISSSYVATASLANSSISSSYAATASIMYASSSNFSLSEIEVADYSSDVAVTFVNGRLKFVFGTPLSQSITSFAFSPTFLTDRFNKVTSSYTASATWANNGYTLIAANIYTGSVLLATTSTGTTLNYRTTTSGSQNYTLHVTASSPLDNSILVVSSSIAGDLSKIGPGNPTLTVTPSVQLGAASSQIEQGATGSLSFTSASSANNYSWSLNYVSANYSTPFIITGSSTGSTSISITATSYYSSSGVNGSDNSPALTTTSQATSTYTKIRSLRSGASPSSSYTQTELENLALWDTSIGGSIGTISKGTTTATGQSVTITWSGDKYHYIAYNGGLSNLTSIKTSGFEVLSSFTLTAVGGSTGYKVYRTTTLQAGGSGTSITYALT